MNILITGATGFLGKIITYQVADHFDKVYLLVRNLEKFDYNYFSKFKNIVPLQGEITNRQLFANNSDRDLIINNVNVVLHAAALYDLTANATDAYTTNIIGTTNLVDFSSQIKYLNYFHYLSTIAIRGDLSGDLFESHEHIPKVKYSNEYSKTKMAAEIIVRKFKKPDIKVRIYRPGIVVGDSKHGSIQRIDGPYYLLNFFNDKALISQFIKKSPFIFLPYHPETILPIIPVDLVCDWISHMIAHPKTDNFVKIYNLVPHNCPTVETFLKALKSEFKLPGRFKPINHMDALFDFFAPRLNIPREIIPYMQSIGGYLVDNRINDYPELEDHFSFKAFEKVFFKGFKDFCKKRS